MTQKQTAVEWFAEQLGITNGTMLDKAKQMEKEQIIDAFDEGQEYEYQYHINSTPKFDSATYFAETYGSNGSDEHIGDTDEMIDDQLIGAKWENEHIEHNLDEISTSSQTEISDEEIEKAFTVGSGFQKTVYTDRIEGAKWYREQLKQRQ